MKYIEMNEKRDPVPKKMVHNSLYCWLWCICNATPHHITFIAFITFIALVLREKRESPFVSMCNVRCSSIKCNSLYCLLSCICNATRHRITFIALVLRDKRESRSDPHRLMETPPQGNVMKIATLLFFFTLFSFFLLHIFP